MPLAQHFPALGFQPDKRIAYVRNRTNTNVVKGQLVEFNLYMTGAETTNNRYGDTASGFAGVVPAPVFGNTALFGVSLDDAADNALMRVQVSGIAKANLSLVKTGEFTGMTWNESAKTLTKAGAFAGYFWVVQDRIEITDGTGATPGFYRINSKTNDVLTLASSIGAAADGESDIDGIAYAFGIEGLSLTAGVSGSAGKLSPSTNLTGKTLGILLDRVDPDGGTDYRRSVLLEGLRSFGTGS